MLTQLIGTTSGISADVHAPGAQADNVRVRISTEGLQAVA
jgi:hypothetical protein